MGFVVGEVDIGNADASISSLPLPTGASTEATLAALLAALSPGTPTAFANAGTITATRLRGVTIANTSTTARAQIRLRNSVVTGTILDTITLGPGESVSYSYPAGRTVAAGTLYMELVSGTV